MERLREMEKSIEDTMWKSNEDEDYDQAVKTYEAIEKELRSMTGRPGAEERERLRILSYCIMRHTDALGYTETPGDPIKRSEEALELAEHFAAIITDTRDESEDRDVIQVYGWTLIVRVNILLGKSLYSQAEELAKHALGVLGRIDNYAGLRTANGLLARIYEAKGEQEEAKSCRESAEYYAELAKEKRQ
jgi:tetratricopeptide (TPR) repeat protein